MKMDLKNCAGKFITLEGIEGVGKSTQLKLLTQALSDADVEFITTREPGGTEIAEAIRGLLLEHHKEPMDPVTELLLLFASRAQHIAQIIKPALHAGKCVICDRFTDATYAYQGGGRGIDMQKILELENLVQENLRPDLTIVLDASDIDRCLIRAKGVGTGDRIEVEKRSFFERVREVYLARANGNPRQFRVIDAAKSINDVQTQILQVIHEKFSNS